MIELDKYTVKARLYPSFLVLLPVFIVSVYYITDFEKYYHYFTALIGVGLFTFLLSQIGRDKGKLKEPNLHKYFGGKPTTQILRHRNNYIDSVTKQRYHKLLSQKIADIQIPSELEETNNSTFADQVYDSCAKFLISKTRDTKKFNLLFKENISYGFRRNLWGMKIWALLLLLFCFGLHFYFATKNLTVFNHYETKDIGLFAFLLATTLFWLLIVNKNWIKLPAFAYAERLYETLNELE
ncbi:MAG: hypothetical protein IPI88_19140 [Chitinophagaceae bacterium]|nr:hypothetical protein [Chitinophagaceae bacterium]